MVIVIVLSPPATDVTPSSWHELARRFIVTVVGLLLAPVRAYTGLVG